MATIFRPPIIQSIKPRSRLVDLWYGGNNLLGTTLIPAVAGDPFFQLDWPNPRKARLAANLQWENNLLESTLFQPPFSFYDWPNPQRRVYAAALWYGENNLLGTTLIPAVADPFFMLDWPNSQRRVQLMNSQLENNLLETTLGGVIPFAGMTMFRDSRQR